MLDPIKMQKITQLVQNASILNAQEKAEWLSLMGLMNDKQLAELETILQGSGSAEVIQQAEAPKPSPIIEAQTPSLGHISNLPSRMTDPRLAIKPAQSVSTPGPERDFARNSKIAPMQTTQPADRPLPDVSEPKPVRKPDVSDAGLATGKPVISSPAMEQAVGKDLKLLVIDDIKHLTAEALHHRNRANFFAAISALSETEGYFNILTHFEESPLYQDYLNYGKLLLSGASGDNLPLSQEEFEFVADLLQALKINRV